jgi:hypothetical protein
MPGRVVPVVPRSARALPRPHQDAAGPVKSAAEISERKNDAVRYVSGRRDVDASILVLERGDSGRVLCEVKAVFRP